MQKKNVDAVIDDFGRLKDNNDIRNEKELKVLSSDCTKFDSFYDIGVDGKELYNEIALTVRCCSTFAVTLCPRLLWI